MGCCVVFLVFRIFVVVFGESDGIGLWISGRLNFLISRLNSIVKVIVFDDNKGVLGVWLIKIDVVC